MSAELQQSATNALDIGVKTASGFTISTGFLTMVELLPQLLGCVASTVGIYVTIALYVKKSRIYKLQESELKRHEDAEDN